MRPPCSFRAIEQATRPDEFRRQNSQSEQDREPARSRRDDHHDAERKQREPEENLQEALPLLQTFNEHLLGPLHPIRCSVHTTDTKIFLARGLPITGRVSNRKVPFRNGLSARVQTDNGSTRFQLWEFFPCEG